MKQTTQTIKQDTLAVVIPSRGLMFSETLEEVLRELEGFKYKIFWSLGRSLPACFEIPTEEALADSSIYAILFVEEDMIIPKGILKEMFEQKYPVVALDYPFKQDGDSTCLHNPNGMAYWTGTGFMLVARQILENMEKPIWRTDTTYEQFIDKDTLHWWPRKLDKIYYGLHDLRFGLILYSNGVPVLPMERTAGQRKLVKLGEAHTNNGAHEIKELTKVGRDVVSGKVDPENIEKLFGALNRVKHVKFWEDIPPFISYDENEQPYLNDGRDFTIVR